MNMYFLEIFFLIILDFDSSFSFRSDTNPTNWDAQMFFDSADVCLGLLGKLIEVGNV